MSTLREEVRIRDEEAAKSVNDKEDRIQVLEEELKALKSNKIVLKILTDR
jgi:hypothetical protein